MNISAVSVSNSHHNSIDDMLAEYVDSFFIDGAEARIDATGRLTGVFKADFFGEFKISKPSCRSLRGDIWAMATTANEFFERLMTEQASHGIFAASDRPVTIPDGFTTEYTPPAE